MERYFIAKDVENVHIYKTIDSTNVCAKKMAENNCPHGTVVIAKSQTAGRGRLGRTFYSPYGTGLYMSIVLNVEDMELAEVTLATPIAAVITAEVIEDKTNIKCGIKWVNDLYIKDKKVCGILTEGITSKETGRIDRLIVGIGINIETKIFPDEIKETATSIIDNIDEKVYREVDTADIKKSIALGIINKFRNMASFTDRTRVMEEYRKRQIVIGRKIKVISLDNSYTAKAVDIDKNGGLVIEKSDGKRETLNSGEISIGLN